MTTCGFILVVFLLEEKEDVDHAADEVECAQNNSKEEMPKEVHFIQAPHSCELVVKVLVEMTRLSQIMFQQLACSLLQMYIVYLAFS